MRTKEMTPTKKRSEDKKKVTPAVKKGMTLLLDGNEQ